MVGTVKKVKRTPPKRRVLITGSSGMLGIDLSRELNVDCQTIGLDLARNPHSTVRRFYRGDITDAKSVAVIIADVRPDVVVHAAAWTDVDGCEIDKKKAFRINSDGARNVAEACAKNGCAIVYISTDFVFDGRKKRPYRETDRPHPLSVYGRSKLDGEERVSSAVKEYFILRTSWLYGKRGKNFVDTIIAKGASGAPLKVVRDQVGCPTYTKDLAKAIHLVVKKGIGPSDRRTMSYGTYHVSNAGKVSWYDYARTILRLVGCRTSVEPISSEQLNRPAKRPASSELDTTKLFRATKLRMRSWKTALKDYIKNGR